MDNSINKKTDPVCGMTVEQKLASETFNYNEYAYYFCSARCLNKFKANPEAFITNKPKNPRSEQIEPVYICPMHSDVRQIGPGSCSICGMSLEPEIMVLENETPDTELMSMRHRFWVSIVLTIPVFFLAMSHHFGIHVHESILSPTLSLWLQFILTTPVILWCGWPFLVKGYHSIINRNLNMFTLISIGITAAYGYSTIALLWPDLFPRSLKTSAGLVAVYFEPAALITALVLMGQVLELRARKMTGSAIRMLLGLTPKTARLIRHDGTEVDITIADVKPGDVLRVRPGETVPVDGTVTGGKTSVNESMITGESIPVEKTKGDAVISGTTNDTGTITILARRVGNETLLAHIVRLVSQAQRSRAPIQRLADKVASWFVPAVVLIAVLTFIIWSIFGPQPRPAYALLNAIAVLIIACPCALGLATPLSVMVGTGRGAAAGILIKNAEALEILEKVNTLVIDKTGTLTVGKPQVVAIHAANDFDKLTLLSFAASLENSSEHPLASAVLAHARKNNIIWEQVHDFDYLAGRGVQGTIGSRRIALGNQTFMDSLGVAIVDVAQKAEEARKQVQTIVFIAVNNRSAGFLAITDPIKESTYEAIKMLRDENIELIMLTGDNRTTALSIAKQLGINKVEAQILPNGKNEIVKQLQQQNRIVAMAGDGINDAPALAQAQVGIAMGTGTDIAMETAAITLIKGDLRGIVKARILSKATMRFIRQYLFLAFIYNTLGIPIAAGLLYPFWGIVLSPAIAAAAMSFSSVSVIANALRLRNLKL